MAIEPLALRAFVASMMHPSSTIAVGVNPIADRSAMTCNSLLWADRGFGDASMRGLDTSLSFAVPGIRLRQFQRERPRNSGGLSPARLRSLSCSEFSASEGSGLN